MKNKFFTLITILILPVQVLAESGILSYVVDGDTVYFGDVKCRLAYIDAPESHLNEKAVKDALKCPGIKPESMIEAGSKSTIFITSQLEISKNYLYKTVDIDKYGRNVCLIESNGTSLNLLMIEAGYAVPFERYISDVNIKDTYRKATDSAKMNKFGLWKSNQDIMECMEVTHRITQ